MKEKEQELVKDEDEVKIEEDPYVNKEVVIQRESVLAVEDTNVKQSTTTSVGVRNELAGIYDQAVLEKPNSVSLSKDSQTFKQYTATTS